jgi:hypothetical protein
MYSYDSRVQMHNVIYELTPIPGTTQRARSIGELLLAARLASLVVKLTDILGLLRILSIPVLQ